MAELLVYSIWGWQGLAIFSSAILLVGVSILVLILWQTSKRRL
jgi:hypothetical protein